MSQAIPQKTYETGQIIFHEGDSVDGLYVIRKGKVNIMRNNVVLATLGPNEFFGEMALVDKRPRSATAVAAETTTCARVTTIDFQKRVAALDPLMQGILRVLIERIRIQNDTLQTTAKSV